MALYEDRHADKLKAYLAEKIKNDFDCGAEPDTLADYVLITLNNDGEADNEEESCRNDLKEFFGDQTDQFVDLLFHTLRTRAYLPRRAPSPIQLPPAQPAEAASETAKEPAGERKRRRSRSPESRSHRQRRSRSPERRRRERSPAGVSIRGSFDPKLMDVPLDAVGKMLDSQNERQHLQSHHVQQQQLQMQQQQQQFQMEQMHQLQQQQQPGQQQRAQRRATKPCYEFLRKGRCKRGSECNFQHVSLAEAMAMDPNLPATVVAGAQQSMMANGAGMPVFAPGTQFGSAPQPQQLPQQQQQQFYNNGGAQRPPPNNDAPMSTTAVYVTNIPDEALSEESVREFFGKFGTIVSVRMDFQRHSAHIDYTEPQAQQQALSTPEAIFNNRFVRVLKGRLPRGAAAPSADASAGASAPPAEPAVPIWRPKSARIKKAELIDKYVKQQKSYFDKLKTPGLTADMKSVIMSSLKTISAKLAELQKPSAPPVAAAAATPESPAPGENADEPSSQPSEREALAAKLQALQAETQRLGASTRGGRGRGRGRGAWAGGVSRGSMSLDKRPRSVVLKNVTQDAAERMDSAMGQFGEIEAMDKDTSSEHPPFTYTVKFRQRWEAEGAMKAINSVDSFGDVSAEWGSS